MITREQINLMADDVMLAIPEIKKSQVVVTEHELAKFIGDHTQEENILMLCLWPSRKITGEQDNTRWGNVMGFFFLDKTDYSEHDQESFLAIFDRTEDVARRFIEKLLEDKSENGGFECNAYAHLDEGSISCEPIKMNNGCNGHYVEFIM